MRYQRRSLDPPPSLLLIDHRHCVRPRGGQRRGEAAVNKGAERHHLRQSTADNTPTITTQHNTAQRRGEEHNQFCF